jgi:hypothetical protein
MSVGNVAVSAPQPSRAAGSRRTAERRSKRFYSAYFGFDPASAQEYENSTVIVRNADGFHLALHPPGHVEPPPALGVGQFSEP